MPGSCLICGADRWKTAYEGPVRDGTFGRTIEGTVYRCLACQVELLPLTIDDLDEFYESEDYRESVGQEGTLQSYFSLHDAQQRRMLGILSDVAFRNAIVMDIGCAGGAFLDTVGIMADETIAVEPARFYHSDLAARGHRVYESLGDVPVDLEGQVNVATSFAVIEHLGDPVGFLRQIRRLIADGGVLFLTTPNRNDILMQMGGAAYAAFWYRRAHVHYFDATSLKAAVLKAGFRDISVEYFHRFDFGNFAGWLREGKPSGRDTSTPLGAEFDALWRARLEGAGASDYLLARCIP